MIWTYLIWINNWVGHKFYNFRHSVYKLVNKANLVLQSHKEHKSKRRSSDSKSDGKASLPKSRSLVDAMREQVQQKQEIEARRKAAIEEMMARELERRVGPPRKRPTPEDPSLHGDWESKKTKVLEYEHGRRSRRDERESTFIILSQWF